MPGDNFISAGEVEIRMKDLYELLKKDQKITLSQQEKELIKSLITRVAKLEAFIERWNYIKPIS